MTENPAAVLCVLPAELDARSYVIDVESIFDCSPAGPLALFARAKLWGVAFAHEPQWKKHWLAEPQERVRELIGDEGERLDTATRDDSAPFFAFVRASGLRLRECLLRWPEVDWEARQIKKSGKGGKLITVPVTSVIRSILWALRGHHAEHVFTYVARRTRGGRVKGQRYPSPIPA